MSNKTWEFLAKYDNELRKKYGPHVCGVDEAGRGSWAGPLYAAAVVLKEDARLPGLDDSKKMTKESRAELYDKILENCIAYRITAISPEDLDIKGLNPSNVKAMVVSAEGVRDEIEQPIGVYVVDQSPRFTLQPYIMMPKADGTSLAVAAASVLAKHSRDEFMKILAKTYPKYGLDTHMGYVNDIHKEAVLAHGLVKGLHRHTYKIKGVTAPHQCTLEELFG